MIDKASAGKGETKPSPEYLPLPALTDSIAYDLKIAVTEARVQLYEALKVVWIKCFPHDVRLTSSGRMPMRVEPAEFFPPFVSYGVQYYETYARSLLGLKPEFSDYQAWVNHALKIHVSDQLAPYRQDGQNRQLSEWQLHMGTTWRHVHHPQRSALFADAKKLIDALEDAMEPEWGNFGDALQIGMAQRTLPLLAEGLKALRKTVQPEAPDLPALGSDAAERIECALKDAQSFLLLGNPTETRTNNTMVLYLDSIAWEYVLTQSSTAFEALIDKIGSKARNEFAGDAAVAEDQQRYWISEAQERAANGIIGRVMPIRVAAHQIQIFHDLEKQFRAMPGARGDLQVAFFDETRFNIFSDYPDPTDDILERQKFELLARQAMAALDFRFADSSRAIFYWLQFLKQKSPHFKQWKSYRLCFASADFCAELETRAIEANPRDKNKPGYVASKQPKKAPRSDDDPQFPKRAHWLSERLRERAWNKHDLSRHGGPEHKTAQKILDGLAVREDVLEKVVAGLSKKGGVVTILSIPPD